MSRRTLTMSDELHQYMLSVSVREPEILRKLRQETASLPAAGMQISVEQGQFMSLLVQLIGAKKTLEVGVFTGYSSLVVALAMPADSKTISCDVNEQWTAIARRYWKEAGVAHKIDLRLAPAIQTLQALLAEEGQVETFDFAFIDADKDNYDHYYEAALQLLRPGGLIGIDNTLWSGRVADHTAQDRETVALRALNAKIHKDERVTPSLLPIGDGLTLALKR